MQAMFVHHYVLLFSRGCTCRLKKNLNTLYYEIEKNRLFKHRGNRVYVSVSCLCLESPLTSSSTDLSEPVDVYSDWIDACEAANQ